MRGLGFLRSCQANKRPALAFFLREGLKLSSAHHLLPLIALPFPKDKKTGYTGPIGPL